MIKVYDIANPDHIENYKIERDHLQALQGRKQDEATGAGNIMDLVQDVPATEQFNKHLLVFNYAGRALNKQIHNFAKSGKLFDLRDIVHILFQVISGLLFCVDDPKVRIYHNDIKPENILVEVERSSGIRPLPRVIIIDFNSSTI